MPVDKVKPLKIEDATSGTEINFGPTETDPTEDYLAAKGLALENDDATRVEKVAGEVAFVDATNGTKKVSDLLDAEQEDFDPQTSGLVSVKTAPAIRELADNAAVSASPGFSFGREGNVTVNTWLNRPGGVSSNNSGINFGLLNGSLDVISVGTQNPNTYDVTVYQHDGNGLNLVTIATVSITASRKEVFVKDDGDFTETNAPVKNKHFAIRITSGSCRNVGVDLQLSGTKT